MGRVRSLKSSSDKLDKNLGELQDKGFGINQILPCPESMDCKSQSPKSDAFNVNVSMNFMIVYVDPQED